MSDEKPWIEPEIAPMKVSDEKSCETCYWNDEDGEYVACIVSRGRTGEQLCINLGGKADRWCVWPSCPGGEKR